MPKKSGKTAARERKADKSRERKEERNVSKESQENLSRKSASRKEVDLDSWIEKNIDELVSRAGLDYLGLSRELWIEVLRDIATDLYGSTTSYKTADEVARKLVRNSERVFPVLASRLAQILVSPSIDQLEFVVTNIGEAVLGLAPKIYTWLSKSSRSDLLEILRYKWASTWSRTKTSLLPAACPKCGFNSLMPDLACLVCGASITEKELKTSIDFSDRLRELLNSMDCSELRDLVNYDYVLVNDIEIKPPSASRLPVDIEVYLNRAERELVREAYRSRCLSSEIT
ncbi:MAG: hypothetical protein RMI56_00950 [Sulfolobales archaeon]|nr:hypothetical protein [Sulfolobales archaeon]MDW8082347.1 hypothetical protein [Sulfolobales archaeon]